MNADLAAAHQAEPVLEADLRSGVEAEQVASKIAEITRAERRPEAVGDPERALVPRHPQRGRQT